MGRILSRRSARTCLPTAGTTVMHRPTLQIFHHVVLRRMSLPTAPGFGDPSGYSSHMSKHGVCSCQVIVHLMFLRRKRRTQCRSWLMLLNRQEHQVSGQCAAIACHNLIDSGRLRISVVHPGYWMTLLFFDSIFLQII